MITTYTEIKCDRCGRTERKYPAEATGLFEGWGRMGFSADMTNFGATIDLCPKCLKIMQGLARRKRVKKDPPEQTKKPRRNRVQPSGMAGTPKGVGDTTSDLPECPGCQIKATCTVKKDVASRVDCWSKKQEKGELSEK